MKMSIPNCANRSRPKPNLIETDRLLELIDQFAEAEGRMKWAPNKKLHFEVAVIKAIQSLGQATLDEVIEKLGELRDGKVRQDEPSVTPVSRPKRERPRRESVAITRPPASNKTASSLASDSRGRGPGPLGS